jgi:hypothetical protein
MALSFLSCSSLLRSASFRSFSSARYSSISSRMLLWLGSVACAPSRCTPLSSNLKPLPFSGENLPTGQARPSRTASVPLRCCWRNYLASNEHFEGLECEAGSVPICGPFPLPEEVQPRRRLHILHCYCPSSLGRLGLLRLRRSRPHGGDRKPQINDVGRDD